MGALNKNCEKGLPSCSNGAFVVLILFILMAIIVGGRFF